MPDFFQYKVNFSHSLCSLPFWVLLLASRASLTMEAALLWPRVSSDLLTSAVSCQQTADGEPTERARLLPPDVTATSFFFFFFEARFVHPSSGLLSSSLFRRVGYSGLFQQGVSDFFWLGRFWMALWRGITVVLEWSEFNSPASPEGMFHLLQRKMF